MNTIDDPVIPDDLSHLLRAGTEGLDVTPAPLGSVERRARQRRRRRHSLIAGGAAALVLLAGLAVAQVGRSEPDQQTVIATSPPAEPDSVPQPLLLRKAAEASGLPTGPDEDRGGTLVTVTADGATEWWSTTGEWLPAGAFELADGRRFGLATTNSTGLGLAPKARLDEIGDGGRSLSSKTIPLGVPWGSFSASIRAIGVTGNEVVLQREVSRQEPIDDGSFKVLTTTTYAAVDVDSGTERPLGEADVKESTYSGPTSAAADDVMVRTAAARCELTVSRLTGREARTVAGGCPRQDGGAVGTVTDIAVSPDGRYAAVLSRGFQAGSPAQGFEVIDLDDGSSVVGDMTTEGDFQGIAWTGVHVVTIAVDPSQDPIERDEDGVTIRSVPYDRVTGAPGD